MYPSDTTLPRISLELSKRMLCVFSVWKVKSLQFQLVVTSKKRKLSDNLFTEELQEDEPVVQDWENYLERLQILLLAYALAGVHPLPQSSSTKFVEDPLDVLMEYFHRAKRTTCMLFMGRRLQWLAEERALWVQKYRESSKKGKSCPDAHRCGVVQRQGPGVWFQSVPAPRRRRPEGAPEGGGDPLPLNSDSEWSGATTPLMADLIVRSHSIFFRADGAV